MFLLRLTPPPYKLLTTQTTSNPSTHPYQSAVGVVREYGSKGEGQSDVSKVDEDERSHRLEADGSTEVAAIQVVAARHVLKQPMERSMWRGGDS